MPLSKTQRRRLGTILSVMFNEDTPKNLLTQVVSDGFVEEKNNTAAITAKGLDEKNRLCTLAGLNIKYKSETN